MLIKYDPRIKQVRKLWALRGNRNGPEKWMKIIYWSNRNEMPIHWRIDALNWWKEKGL